MRKITLDTFNAWHKGKKLHRSASLWTDGSDLYSYGTMILQRGPSGLRFNRSRYSKTTSCHQRGLADLLAVHSISYQEWEFD